MERTYDAVVIGSGFGGSVAALRLAEAGHSVLILERGQNYSAGDFPRNIQKTKEILWQSAKSSEFNGLFDIKFYADMGVVSASGVGGGSLIYASVHVKPSAEVFDDPGWPDDINLTTLEPYFQKVDRELSLEVAPKDLDIPKRDYFHQASRSLNVDVIDPTQAIDWDNCRLCGECEVGCQYGSKLSLDKTYLQKAQKLGTEIRANAQVTFVEPNFHGYMVHFLDLKNKRIRRQVKAKIVVVSAGTLGTNELLLRCRDVYETLPNISNQLGVGFSANGDFLGSIRNSEFSLNPWIGQDVTSIAKIKHNDGYFTLAAPSYNQAISNVLALMGQPQGKMLRFIGPIVWKHFNGVLPWAMSKGLINNPIKSKLSSDPDNFTNLFSMGRDNANGVIKLNNQKLEIEWNYYQENRELIDAMIKTMKEYAKAYGGEFSPMMTWNMSERPLVFHPLGGCRMSPRAEEGVVSLSGEVHGYPGLYVSDASLIPSSIGYNPVMTITALAEHNAERMIDSI